MSIVLLGEDHAGILHDQHTSISIGGRPVCNLRFADDMDLMGGSKGELRDLTNRHVDTAMVHGMEVSTEKSKTMTNSTNNISADFSTNGQRLEEVTSFSTWEQPCAKMAPAQQKSASGLPQQRQQWLNRTWPCNTISLQAS